MNHSRLFFLSLFCLCASVAMAQLPKDSLKALPWGKKIKYKLGFPVNVGDREYVLSPNKKEWKKGRQGDIDFLFMPYSINGHSVVSPLTHRSHIASSIGLGFAMEYFNENNQSFIIRYNYGSPLLIYSRNFVDKRYNVPICMVDETVITMDLSISKSFYWNNFSIGCGVSLTGNGWKSKYYGDDNYLDKIWESERQYHYRIGTPIYIKYHFTHVFALAVNYRPSFYEINRNWQRKYEDVIGIDFQFRIRGKKNQ